ncbi:AAA family ATPase [Colwellia psychrerythraea]|uniref:Peptidoglycan-binding lysin domain-containing protein n=1 Tax=Colwellia psychrerythraea TaxID=28229 RepID=A0A099KG76_COLPS|nr:AAA family ATPase [Colwellia psychrerythraea]KGJ89002.1 Peptidoglycan-binding lysin domain-containing protein [Colwellia psychrerythraea]
MYREFFSLSELPFSISPDPRYLFMSDRHKEALTHLTYGLGEVGGFALLTGEVGTGKTTISRCLMERLPDNTQVAFILNPTLSCQELLATLCDQLTIDYQGAEASLKTLTDKISEKLLTNHENEINTLLIIDEAQHLQPEVLEQLRLLTNLETNTKKLLQVILIGQPELQQLLQRRDLRQLAQRITARYHLLPLTKKELDQYIQHRLAIADCVRPLFDKSALNKIHQLSQGIPRLTNLLCHSSLMLAYNQNDSIVNNKTVIAAAKRVLGEDITGNKPLSRYSSALVLFTVLSIAALFTLTGIWWGQSQKTDSEVLTTNIEKKVSNTKSTDVYEGALNDISNSFTEEKHYVIYPPEVLHTVRLGETLYQLSNKYKVDLKALRQWNNISKTNEIHVGDKLYVVDPLPVALSGEDSVQVSTFDNDEAIKLAVTKKYPSNNQVSETLTINAEQLALNDQVKQNKKQTKQAVPNPDMNYQVTKVKGVSSDLLARFQAAIDDTEGESQVKSHYQEDFLVTDEQLSNDITDAKSIKPLTQMSQKLKNSLPSLQFEQHIYVSDGQGWVKVNGQDRFEGDNIANNLIVVKILPQQVILAFQGEKFSLPALTNW